MISFLHSAKFASLMFAGGSAILLGAAPQPLSHAAGESLVGGTAKGCRNVNTKCVPNTYNCSEVLPDCDRRDPVVNTMQCRTQTSVACGGMFCGAVRPTRKCE